VILLRDSSHIQPEYEGSVVALGNFDGLHLGHIHVIEEAIRIARATGKPAGIITFEPHPRRLFRPHLPPLRLLSLSDKLHRLTQMQLDMVRLIRFTRAFSETTATEFIEDILHSRLKVSHVVTGDDFIFGHNREGNVAFLRQEAVRLGFGFIDCAPVMSGGERCSSSRIRALLTERRVCEAAKVLGRFYSIIGRVQEGDKRGRRIGFPTANIIPSHLFTPANGVYAVRAHTQGQWVPGVANLGVRPTFGGSAVRLEVHLFDWSGDLYGKRLEVEFVDCIREERAFPGIEALKDQIQQDADKARAMLRLVQ
jgi:riboflavin kinase/FMN adenylyltransferase